MDRQTIEHRARNSAGMRQGHVARCLDSFWIATNPVDQSITPHLIRDGYWEAWITAWFYKNVRENMTVIDIGANMGYYTMIAERLGARVVAYEANPTYVELLKETRALNGSQFSIRPVAVSDARGEVTLSVPKHLTGSASIVMDFEGGLYEGENTKVRAVKLDDERAGGWFDKVDVLKIDAEGAEQRIWEGGAVTLESCPVVLLEYTPGAYDPEFFEEMEAWGTVYAIDGDGNEYPTSYSAVESVGDWTMLVVRKHG